MSGNIPRQFGPRWYPHCRILEFPLIFWWHLKCLFVTAPLWEAQTGPSANLEAAVGDRSIPSGKRVHNYWKSTSFNGKTQDEWALFNSYVKLPESIWLVVEPKAFWKIWNFVVFAWRKSQLSKEVYKNCSKPPTRYVWECVLVGVWIQYDSILLWNWCLQGLAGVQSLGSLVWW